MSDEPAEQIKRPVTIYLASLLLLAHCVLYLILAIDGFSSVDPDNELSGIAQAVGGCFLVVGLLTGFLIFPVFLGSAIGRITAMAYTGVMVTMAIAIPLAMNAHLTWTLSFIGSQLALFVLLASPSSHRFSGNNKWSAALQKLNT